MEKEKLEILKEGKTGHGILIESDGYIKTNKETLLKEGIDTNGEWHCPNPFIVEAVFQKADIKNANGRIYPRPILEREIEKYQQKIAEHRALGECYTPDVLVLCEDGWKCISSVTENDNVLTLNVETNKIEIQKVTRKIEFKFEGKLLHLEGKNISESVTPNHGFPLYDANTKSFSKFMTAIELYNLKNKENLYIPSLTENIDLTSVTIDEKEYDGEVMCIEVPNHTFYVKSNGKSHWSKNCNHPSETTIDLGRISHNIIELHWEGSTVVGKMELNISEGYRRSGICSTLGDTVANLLLNGYKIGVSSRAIGSVEQKFGTLVVGDDLELICWDVVSDPSTPGAWIGDSHETLQTYIESKQVSQNKTPLQEKIDKIKNVLK